MSYICAPMKRTFALYWVVVLALVFTGCKTEFERVRASNNPPLMLEKAFEHYEANNWEKAQILFEQALNFYRAQQEAESLYFHYAYTFYHMKQYLLAGNYFKNFANTFTNSEYREEALFMVAFSEYKMSPTFRLDQSHSYKAIDAFQLFANTYPASERVETSNRLIDELRKKLEQKAFYQGQLYYDLKDYRAAVKSFENLLQDFPETNQTDKVRYMIVKSSYYLAYNSIYEKQVERYQEALKYADHFLERHPKSDYSSEVKDFKKQASIQLKQFEQ